MGGIISLLIKVRNSGLLSIKFLCVTLWHMRIYSRRIFPRIQQVAILPIKDYRRFAVSSIKPITSSLFSKMV